MQVSNIRHVDTQIQGIIRACTGKAPALGSIHNYVYSRNGGYLLWRERLVLRGVLAYRPFRVRLLVDEMYIQPGYQWSKGAELELLGFLKVEAQGKQIVWLTDDCDLREWLADQGFTPKRSKSGRSAMVLSNQESPVAQRLRKYFR